MEGPDHIADVFVHTVIAAAAKAHSGIVGLLQQDVSLPGHGLGGQSRPAETQRLRPGAQFGQHPLGLSQASGRDGGRRKQRGKELLQLRQIHRLLKIKVGPQGEHPLDHRLAAHPGDHHDPRPAGRRFPLQLGQQGKSAHPGHHQIQQHQIRTELSDQPQAFRAVSGLLLTELQARYAAQTGPQKGPGPPVILYQQHPDAIGPHLTPAPIPDLPGSVS